MRCPVCKCNDTSVDGLAEFDDFEESAYREWICNECESRWHETGDIDWNGDTKEIEYGPDYEHLVAENEELARMKAAQAKTIPLSELYR